MRTTHFHRLTLGLPIALVLAGLPGCSTTSPVALQQANHTVGLMSQLDQQLAEFRRVLGAAETARLDSLRRQRATLIRVDKSVQLNAQASKSAGDTKREPFAQKLLADADGFAEINAQSKAQAGAHAAKLDSLLVPLPSTTASIAQAQSKLALLGRELDSQTRFQEAQAFLQEVADALEADRKKIAEAEAGAAKAAGAAASAPVPAATSSK